MGPMSAQVDQRQWAQQRVESARSGGVELAGPDGVLTGLTKQVHETALEAEMSEHVGYEPHARAGHHSGNSRSGTRSKTVHTEIGPVEIDVRRDRDGSFEPQLVKKRQRRLSGIDEIVLSLTARGLTTGIWAGDGAEGGKCWLSVLTEGLPRLRLTVELTVFRPLLRSCRWSQTRPG
ncbi:mutator family transposase [Prauserella shujinwangii]|uniref:Mutator family transposase n=1 Tax=Prauserella shujinwangii TaxID=1453103 RepID=A0A2T0LTP2_9PSEU|nr:mutator family transposase [Prauserella shujinwangii]